MTKTYWPDAALSFMAIDNPNEEDILSFIDTCTPFRERDEAIAKRNIAFRLLGKTTGRLNIEPADPIHQTDEVWYPSRTAKK